MYCKKCGTQNDENVKFCKSCGEKLGSSTAGPKNAMSSDGAANKSNFFKTREGKIIAGICAGLGKKFNNNPWIYRIGLIIAGFIPIIGWILWIAYLVCIFVLKYEE